jgi:acetyl esterase/lipase
MLTGEAVAWFIHEKLPVPGAIGTFCGSVIELGGDSAWVAPVLDGDPPPTSPLKLSDPVYFKGAKASGPLVFPGNSPALLAKLPPTLLSTGTRDFTMSSEIQSQRLLDRRQRRCGTARMGRHVALVFFRPRDAGVEGSLRRDGEVFRSASGAMTLDGRQPDPLALSFARMLTDAGPQST